MDASIPVDGRLLAGMGGGESLDGHLHRGAAELRQSRAPVGANRYVRPFNLKTLS